MLMTFLKTILRFRGPLCVSFAVVSAQRTTVPLGNGFQTGELPTASAVLFDDSAWAPAAVPRDFPFWMVAELLTG
jgi:hypothetical protein